MILDLPGSARAIGKVKLCNLYKLKDTYSFLARDVGLQARARHIRVPFHIRVPCHIRACRRALAILGSPSISGSPAILGPAGARSPY